MPDTTDNFGLRYPLDTDSIDTAGDIQRLAEDVDGALGSDVVLRDGAARPTKYVGTGRPDGRGGDDEEAIVANAGDTYTCTDPDGAGNYGAREWQYDGSLWHCVEGDTGYRAVANNTTWTGAAKVSKIQKHDNAQVDPTGTRVRGMQRWGKNFYLFVFWNEASLNTTNTGYFTVWFADGGDPFTGVGTASGFSDSASASLAYGVLSGFCGNNNVRFSCELGGVNNQIYITGTTDHPWPSGVDGVDVPPLVSTYIAELKAKIEENPELADQLRQELESLRGEDV